ncbi:MAG: type II toxin-antitoxin system RelB/DinJ family antitoxin [Opitutus sp.]
MATVQIRARIDRNLKRKSDALLHRLGLDAGAFFAMALTQLVNRRGLPFAVTDSDEAYFTSEYALTADQAAKAGNAMAKESASARGAGKLRELFNAADLVP